VSAVSIAAANADTWASEIGKLYRDRNVSIVTFKPIKKGESGGISLLGTLASVLGSALIALSFSVMYGFATDFGMQLVVKSLLITLCGIIGSIADSYLSILLQGKYLNKESGEIEE